jgi:hypothetical protein
MWSIHMSLVDSSMESAALLACIIPPLLPLLYAYKRGICNMQAGTIQACCYLMKTRTRSKGTAGVGNWPPPGGGGLANTPQAR